MTQEELLALTKKSLRVTSTAFDSEIEQLIDAGKKDIEQAADFFIQQGETESATGRVGVMRNSNSRCTGYFTRLENTPEFNHFP